MLRIKEIIKEKKLTIKDLAIQIGISREMLTNIVNEKNKPSFDTLIGIATALGVSPSELFEQPKEGVIHCPHCGKPIHLKAEA